MISTEDKQRIEAAAKAHSDKYTTSEQYNEGMFDGYVDGAEAEHERMTELLKAMNEYIILLSKGLGESAGFLDVHGWRYSQYDVEKGIELRAKIESLKSQ